MKTRLEGRGSPLESFTPNKIRQVRRMAANWLASARPGRNALRLRLDAVAVVIDAGGDLVSLECLEGAL